MCSKSEGNLALDVDDRRSSGSNIDAIFESKKLNFMGFAIVEVIGGTTGNHHGHYLEDKNKIGKNLKVMLKTILSLRSDFAAVGSIVKLYGLQVYRKCITHSTQLSRLLNTLF